MAERHVPPLLYPQDLAAELHDEFGYSAVEADRMVERYLGGEPDPVMRLVLASIRPRNRRE